MIRSISHGVVRAAQSPARSFTFAIALAAMLGVAGNASAADGFSLPADHADRLAAAQPPATLNPYIRLHTEGSEVRAVVMGDSLADGMYAGLYRVMKDDARLTFVKKTKVNTGIVRSDRYDWNEAAREIAGEKSYDIAILVFGANELQSIREGGKAYHFRQKGWEERFNARVDDIVASLKAQNIAAYWVGLPITRKDRNQEEYAYVNGLFRQAAQRNGIRYVETWDTFADETGQFTPFGISLDGKKVQLRSDDGVHFTPDGYAKYASVVAEVLRKDVDAVAFPAVAKKECIPDMSGCQTD